MVSEQRDDGAGKPLADATVLLIEDSKFDTEILTRLLRLLSVRNILTARSAEDALYNLEKNDGLADVVILDYRLGGMDGRKFLTHLRAQKSARLRKLPVVVLTGHNSMPVYQKMAALRIAAFLIKPVGRNLLKDALTRALEGYCVPQPRVTNLPDAGAEGSASPRTPSPDTVGESAAGSQEAPARRSLLGDTKLNIVL